jgi:RpiR family carbohydrate utilization transcriptional regulator
MTPARSADALPPRGGDPQGPAEPDPWGPLGCTGGCREGRASVGSQVALAPWSTGMDAVLTALPGETTAAPFVPPMLDRIRASLPALSPAEQRVARLVLADARSFAGLPVAELAERAHVSKPTVVRFCRSVGYDGLADFKLKLAGTINEGVPFVHRAVDEDDKPADLIVKVVDNAVSALLRLRNDATGHAFERAIQALAEAGAQHRRIEFYGVGNSGIVALDAQHKFFRLGVHAVAYSDGHVQVMAATMLGPGDCVVIISNSGRSRDLLDALEIAKKKGATCIVITASGTPLAQQGHVLLAADHPEDYDRYSPMVSRLLHLTIVDILTTGVALRMGNQLRPMLQEIKRNLRVKRYAPDG